MKVFYVVASLLLLLLHQSAGTSSYDALLRGNNLNNDQVDERETPRKIAVVGAGYAGLAAACELRRRGFHVTVVEKNGFVGGRANVFVEQGFEFDAGPSWYWMPEIFEMFFGRFGKQVGDFYDLTLLDPAYRVILQDETVDVPGTYQGFLDKFGGKDLEKLQAVMEDSKEKYDNVIRDWLWKPMLSIFELFDLGLLKAGLELNMFGKYEAYLKSYLPDIPESIFTILKWPVIFIGALPRDAPAMYSLMTYAGHARGTWYPSGGLGAPARAMEKLAKELGVEFVLNSEVNGFKFGQENQIESICLKKDEKGSCFQVDGVVNAADYQFVDQKLLPSYLRNYDDRYWERQVLSPSCIVFYVGVNQRIEGLAHHTFFFDKDLDNHLRVTFDQHQYSDQFTFYVSATSKTDKKVAPKDGENLFILVPVSYRLNGTDTEQVREKIFNLAIRRMETVLRSNFSSSIVFQRSYGMKDFEHDYNSFRGNAFGHANILSQSLLFKPSMINPKVPNLVHAGHMTNPGPGVPPSIVSGVLAAEIMDERIGHHLSTGSFGPWNPLAYLVVAHLIIYFTMLLTSTRCKSYMVCVRLLFQHGRTYFAAATLMDPTRFLDTAAMYGLFRVADDYVDNYESSMEKHENLEAFIRNFWKCFHEGKGDYKLHPVLPAVIESSKRRGYSEELFNRFFESMRMDIGQNVCSTMSATMEYMEGSAAVIGEFMLPVLMPHATVEEYNRALPHARDLGLAFQLTNMIRDIGEDLDLQRQYIPLEICKRYGVDLQKRNHLQPGFSDMMEEMFQHADQFYDSADKGIAMLPKDVRDVIQVARLTYHRIHHKIRLNQYNIFGARVKVPFTEKVRTILSIVPKRSLVRIVVAEIYSNMLYYMTRIPVICILWTIFLSKVFLGKQEDHPPTYAQFHLWFTIPLILIVWGSIFTSARREDLRHYGSGIVWTVVLCLVATIYATPWDNYLVYNQVWGYPPNRVKFSIGYVPVEEYSFFILETVLVGGLWFCSFTPNTVAILSQKPRQKHSWRVFGFIILVALFLLGGFALAGANPMLFYLGLILTWATPVLLLQWYFGANVLMESGIFKSTMFTILSSTTMLSISDNWAISNNIWSISHHLSLPELAINMPFEEVLFFFMTSTMCTWGLTLAMVATTHMHNGNCSLLLSVRALCHWGHQYLVVDLEDASRFFGAIVLGGALLVLPIGNDMSNHFWAYVVMGAGFMVKPWKERLVCISSLWIMFLTQTQLELLPIFCVAVMLKDSFHLRGGLARAGAILGVLVHHPHLYPHLTILKLNRVAFEVYIAYIIIARIIPLAKNLHLFSNSIAFFTLITLNLLYFIDEDPILGMTIHYTCFTVFYPKPDIIQIVKPDSTKTMTKK